MMDRKHNEVNMDWIEIIQLKSFTGQDRESAVAAFQQLSAPLSDASLREIDLFKSPNLENELSILINWYGDVPPNGKSGLGLQLASAFSEFGYIYHSGWRHSSRLAHKVL
jgi:hypothetical protein